MKKKKTAWQTSLEKVDFQVRKIMNFDSHNNGSVSLYIRK